uniref:RAD17 homolog n=1 Tax=Nothobranchius korthausae TaxID=1143690 RepID=A0A1A8F553_9TELE
MNKRGRFGEVSSRKVSSWVDPAFSDLAPRSFSGSGKRKASSSSLPKPEEKTRSSPQLLTETTGGDGGEAWVDTYSPRSQADLAVHRKKVEEVEKWIKTHTDTSKAGVLILTGPSGCGKTATVQVLSQEMGVQVQEWTNTSNLEPYGSSQHADWSTNGFSYSSQLTQFEEFLLRANKYKRLKMISDEVTTNRKLILVEDFPNQFYRHPASLHAVLRRFVNSSHSSLVFVVSESQSGGSRSQALFPRELQEELGISCISFNPVSPTAMKKVLNHILLQETRKSCERVCVPDQAQLEVLCSGSSGDIRSAVNSLQFFCLPEKELLMAKRRCVAPRERVQRISRKAGPSGGEEDQAIGGKDASLFLFRALGKILHCKRGKQDASVPEPGLPPHLLQHHRHTLLVTPELVVERSHMSGELFSLYLHQNYLDFFSDLEDVDRASQYLSDADLLTADWTNRSLLEPYGSSVATRGLLHSHSHQVSSGFRPLHKPSWFLVNKKYRDNCLAAQSLFRSFGLPPVCLQTQLLPYLAKLSNPMRNQTQVTFIQAVGHMSLTRCSGRLKPETLTDKETGEQEEEEEEQRDLQSNQPELSTNQVLLDEEDLNIEDYNSD